MSAAAAHESRTIRKLCQRCLERKARFQYRGQVRSDRDHTLCFECFRSERDRRRAGAIAGVKAAVTVADGAGFRRPGLSRAEVAHRRRMLAHLSGG